MDFKVFEQRYERKLMEKQAHTPTQPQTPCNSVPHVLHEYRCELVLLGKRLQAHIEQSILQKIEFALELSQLRESISEIRLEQTCAEKLQDSEDQGRNQLVDLHVASTIQRPSLPPLPEPFVLEASLEASKERTGARSSNCENSDNVLRPDGVADIDSVVEVSFNRLGYQRNASVTTSPRNGGSFDTPTRASCSNACHTADFDAAGRVRPDEALQVEQPTMLGEPRLTGAPTTDQHAASSKFELEGITCIDQGRRTQSYLGASLERIQDDDDGPDLGANPKSAMAPEPEVIYQISGTSSIADRLLVDEYEFQESVWDLALFIGMPQLGLLGSAYSMMLLFANFALQFGMIHIINEAFTIPEFSPATVTSMRHWRVLFGHSLTFSDELTFESMSSRVCKDDSSLPYSEGVVSIIERIDEYMPSQAFFDENAKYLAFGHLFPHMENIGTLLCIFAIVIWLLEIVALSDRQWHLAKALFALPACKYEGFRAIECISFDREDSVTLGSMSARRKAWCGFLIIMQFLVVIPLAVMGVIFMYTTISMRDLLLNCSALAIVVNTDEMIYAALAPRSGKVLLRALNPLPQRATKTLQGLNWETVFFLVCILSTIAIAMVPLNKLLGILSDTYREVCGGNRDFLAIHDKSGIIVAGNVPDVIGKMDKERLENTYYYAATRQLIADRDAAAKFFAAPGSMSATVSGMTSSIWSLQSQRDLNVVDVMHYWNSACADMLPKTFHRYSPYFLRILWDAFLNSSIESCGDLRMFCSADSLQGTRTRQFCPVTCGCSNRNSSLALDGIVGCPPACIRTDDYNASMWAKACVDEGINSTYWGRYVSGLRSLQASYPPNWVTDFDQSIQTLLDHGCSVIPNKIALSFVWSRWEDPCITSAVKVKGLMYACPASCQCNTNYRSGCPFTCQAAR